MKNERITFVERKITEKRKELIPMAKERAKLGKQMTPAMIDAEKEITRAFELFNHALGFAMQDMNRVDGGSQSNDHDDYSDFEIKLMRTLGEFKNENPLVYGVVINLSALCNSIEDEARVRSRDVNQIMNLYVFGLNQWCILRGFGNQLK